MAGATVVNICIAPTARAPMILMREVHAIPGKGLEGDRYCAAVGSFSDKPGPARQVTLIEMEAIEALRRDYQITVDPKAARRNIVTRGVALNHLVGHTFRIGPVTLAGIRLCEPCTHLEGLTQPGVLRGLVHRGGLRAQILTDGVIRVGDALELV